MTNFISSKRRTYQINLPTKCYQRTLSHLLTLSSEELQDFIDKHFRKSSQLGSSNRSGAWAEGRLCRNKAKMAIVVKEGLIGDDGMGDFWTQEGRLAGSEGF